MFLNKEFNIIVGDRASGKTFFLWDISKILTQFGYKVCYVGATNEYDGDDKFWSHLPLFRTLSQATFSAKNDVEFIYEISQRDKYDFLMIDDVDSMDYSLFKILKGVSAKKILSVWNKIPVIGTTDFNLLKVSEKYNDSDMSVNQSIEFNDGLYEKNDFLKSFERELKINKVLK